MSLIIVTIVIAFIGYLLVRNYVRYFEKLDNIKNRRVVVTGCDSGLGKLLVEYLDLQGIKVYAGCLLESSVQNFNSKQSKNFKAFQVDISSEESVQKAFNFVDKDLNGEALWAIVNNAGILGKYMPLEWHTKKVFKQVFDVNVFGTIDFTFKFIPLLRRGKEGRIINMASINARLIGDGNAYCISKVAVEGFSDALSFTMDQFNITAHTIEPSAFKTNMLNTKQARIDINLRWKTLSDHLKLNYGRDFATKSCDFLEKVTEEFASEKWENILESFEHALFSKYPKNRYQVNNDAKYLYLPLSYLTIPWQIKVLKILLKYSKMERPTPDGAILN